MLLVYIDGSFLLEYSQKNFTVGLFSLVTASIKLTRYRIICFFIFFFNGILSAVNTIKIFLSLFTYKFREEHCFFQTKNFNYVIIRLDWIMFVCVYLQYCRQNHWADAQY
jgi:hypothetical protein